MSLLDLRASERLPILLEALRNLDQAAVRWKMCVWKSFWEIQVRHNRDCGHNREAHYVLHFERPRVRKHLSNAVKETVFREYQARQSSCALTLIVKFAGR